MEATRPTAAAFTSVLSRPPPDGFRSEQELFVADVVFVVLTVLVFAVLALCAKGAERL